MITIKTKDDYEIQVSDKIITMIDTTNVNDMSHQVNILLSSLQFIIAHCENNNYVKPPPVIKPLQYNDFTKCIHEPKDAELLLSKDIFTCFELLKDCSLIKCSSLYDLLCARIGHYFRTTSLCDLKTEFGLTGASISKQEIDDLVKKYQLI